MHDMRGSEWPIFAQEQPVACWIGDRQKTTQTDVAEDASKTGLVLGATEQSLENGDKGNYEGIHCLDRLNVPVDRVSGVRCCGHQFHAGPR